MLESNKNILLRAKAEVEANRDQEVNLQIVNATQQVIEPKLAEIETTKQAALAKAQTEYAATVNGITTKYETEKQTFVDSVKTAVKSKVNAEFEGTIAGIEALLAK